MNTYTLHVRADLRCSADYVVEADNLPDAINRLKSYVADGGRSYWDWQVSDDEEPVSMAVLDVYDGKVQQDLGDLQYEAIPTPHDPSPTRDELLSFVRQIAQCMTIEDQFQADIDNDEWTDDTPPAVEDYERSLEVYEGDVDALQRLIPMARDLIAGEAPTPAPERTDALTLLAKLASVVSIHDRLREAGFDPDQETQDWHSYDDAKADALNDQSGEIESLTDQARDWLESKAADRINVYVNVTGGVVQGFDTDTDLPVDMTVIDFDTEGASPDELGQVNWGDGYKPASIGEHGKGRDIPHVIWPDDANASAS